MVKFLFKFFAALLALIGLVGLTCYFALQKWFEHTELNLVEPVLIEISKGSHARSIAVQLKELGYLEHDSWFYYAVRLFSTGQQARAGVYQLEVGESLQAAWLKWARGEQHYFTITFAEGLNFQEWQEKVAAHPWLSVQTEQLNPEEILSVIKPTAHQTHPEGLLFPDTYRFHAYTTDIELYRQAYERMDEILRELWKTRAKELPIKTPYEALILASIVEKETGAPHERGLVASVFSNRLKSGMRLQSDPTIIYGLGHRYRGVIYRTDIQETTPYNTYRISGLPPTPIAMPGKEAIEAVLNPLESEYYYFVSQNNGTHIFSKTLEAHNKAVQKYQRNK